MMFLRGQQFIQSRITLVIGLLICGMMSAHAGVKVPIFEDTQTVADKTNRARQEGLHTAFARILVKVSGNRQIMTVPSIEQQAKHPEQFLQAYEYQANANDSGEKNSPKWQIRYTFVPGKIEALLKAHGHSVWPAYRPNVLVWWAQGLDPLAQSSEIIGNDSTASIVQTWRVQSALRGIPTTFPMTDLATLATLDVQDIWHLKSAKLNLASQRYHTDVQVALTLRPTKEGSWQGNMTILNNEDTVGWQFSHADPNKLVTAMVDKLADHLSQRQTMQTSNLYPTKRITLLITNIHDAEGFRRVNDYLNTVAQVQTVQALWMKGDQVLMDISFQGDEKMFSEQLKFDTTLAQVTDEQPQHQANLHYKLIG